MRNYGKHSLEELCTLVFGDTYKTDPGYCELIDHIIRGRSPTLVCADLIERLEYLDKMRLLCTQINRGRDTRVLRD